MKIIEAEKNIEKKNKTFLILASVFIGMLTISNVLAFKIIEFSSLLIAPAGVIAYSITYLITDTMVEIFGTKRSKFIVFAGFLTQILVLAAVHVAIILPDAGFFEYQQEFALVLSQSNRIILASLIAYFISQLWDIHIFTYIKNKTGEKFLWLRNNGSTITSQLLDTIVFITIAFAGIRSFNELIGLIVGQYLVKVIIAVIDTPIVYALVYYIRERLNIGFVEAKN